MIPNKRFVCRPFEANYDINNGIIKRPTYEKSKNITKMSWYIGEFHKVNYQPMLKKYAYHLMLFCFLDKNDGKNIRNKYCLADKNTVMK